MVLLLPLRLRLLPTASWGHHGGSQAAGPALGYAADLTDANRSLPEPVLHPMTDKGWPLHRVPGRVTLPGVTRWLPP